MRVFGVVPALEGAVLAARHDVVVRARDGLVLPCQVYLPAGADPDGDGVPDTPLPAVFYVHGGPWIGFEWNSWLTNRSVQLLANRGYAVVRTDFRGAAGYGRAFMDAGDRAWATAMQDDVRDIVDWAVAAGVADEARLALWGWSYGGYTTMAQLAAAPERFACGIAMYGVSDLLALSERIHGLGGDHDLWDRRVGDLHSAEGRALLAAHSPLTHVARVQRPLLVTHGGLDERTPPSQSEAFVDALAAREHPVTYLFYPDEPHDYREDRSWIAFWAVGEHFLARHLGGRTEPYGEALAGARLEVATGAEHVPGLSDALGI